MALTGFVVNQLWSSVARPVCAVEKMKTILFLMVVMFSGTAGAGYLFQGQCWSDTSTALVAYRGQFPLCCSGSPPTMTVEAIPSTISAGGLITEQLNTKTTTQSGWTSGVVTNVQLSSCSVLPVWK